MKHAHIANVLTTKAERRKGYSSLCLKEAINFCFRNEIETIDLSTEINSVAHEIYTKQGFVDLFTAPKYEKA